MTNLQRGALVALALALVAGAFLWLRPAEPPSPIAEPPPSQQGVEARETHPTRSESRGPGDEPPEQPAEQDAGPEPGPLLTTAAVREIRVQRGDVVRFRVRSSTPEEVHVHGYDIHRDVEPGETAHLRFTADLEGIYEIELHGSGVQIGELRVEP